VASDFEKFLVQIFDTLKQIKKDLPPDEDEREAFQDTCKVCQVNNVVTL